MTKLITALASAHRELLSTIAAGGDEKTLSSTARKIEATLVPALKAQDDQVRTALASVIMNSGSLKALKLVPANITPPRWGYRNESPDPAFICAQPAAYMREAQKRGFTISPQMRLELLDELSEATSNHQRMRPEALLLQDPVDEWMMNRIITRTAEMTPEKAARVAPAVTRMLKAGLKAAPDGARQTLATLFCIHDPAAAHEHFYRILALFALLGVKAPPQAEIEHDEMRHLAKLLFGRDGRRDLNSETGGLEAYIASGLTSAASILKPFEDKRRHFTPPGSRRGRMF